MSARREEEPVALVVGTNLIAAQALASALAAADIPSQATTTVDNLTGGPAIVVVEERWIARTGAATRLGERFPLAPVLVIGTGSLSGRFQVLPSTAGLAELVTAVATVSEGGRISSHLTPPIPTLTQREIEILALVAAGKDGHQIAIDLGISPHTVRTHLQKVLAKTGARSRREAVRIARESGLLPTNFRS